ncbi:hypothetical protein [Alkaliphilus hydrothermalis]|uniref:hypothetical protein n=1 Tax=Alkaliphilus hydrothermalis TaxID=1482730 RepID=UPI00195B9631|nr:hypothetical protein [Alkaliphilus hydrothermalis]
MDLKEDDLLNDLCTWVNENITASINSNEIMAYKNIYANNIISEIRIPAKTIPENLFQKLTKF